VQQNLFPSFRIRTHIFACGTALVAGLATSSSANADEAMADLVEKVAPTVVPIVAERNVDSVNGLSQNFDGSGDSQVEEFFRRFGRPDGFPDEDRPRSGVGSGFVLEADGLIVTNHHVIEGATDVTVRLSDGREFTAEIIGQDPQTDLALLDIDPLTDLAFVSLGDSDDIRVGEDVVAVGNPFGLGGTVTSGIVSAKGRHIGAGAYAEFLQTDAAINKGNSGGPLFNMDGDVVGVNSAIFSPTGGSVGIGFAITSNTVDLIVADLRDDGRVDRGWLGVSIQTLTAELGAALGLKEDAGALVASVVENSPADGHIEVGDVITEFDGETVKSSLDLPKLVAAVKSGETADVKVMRDGDEKTLEVIVGAHRSAQLDDPGAEQDQDTPTKLLGATVAPLTDKARSVAGIDDSTSGVVITSLAPRGPAAKAGLQVGDVIIRFGNEEISTPESLHDAMSSDNGDPALVLISRKGQRLFMAVDFA